MKNINKKRLYIIITVVVAICAISIPIINIVYFSTPTEATAVTVFERAYYVAKDKEAKDSVILYVDEKGDTLAALPTDSLFLNNITHTRKGSWVNAHWWASCQGRIAAKADSSMKIAKPLRTEDVAQVMKSIVERQDKNLQLLRSQSKSIEYFIKVHNVMDDGFDVVVRQKERVDAMLDSLTRLQAVCTNCLKSPELHQRYWAAAVMTKSTKSILSVPQKTLLQLKRIDTQRDGFDMWQTTDSHKPTKARAVYLHVPVLGIGQTIGWGSEQSDQHVSFWMDRYEGDVDSVGQHSGTGQLCCVDGTLYEGQWKDGLRNGFGVNFTDRVRCGSWQDDKFLGEKMLYHSDRVYGIDVSRYQHEQGKKIYAIEWSKLRITSLGKISNKRIHGTVSYPISFIYIKSTEGRSVLNKYYANDYKQSRAHGYRTGTYHFFSTTSTASQQAAHFLKNSRYTKGDMPPVLDVEPSDAQIAKMGGDAVLMAAMKQWCETVEKAWGVKPVLYISQNFVNKHLSDYMKDNYHVWIARYGEYKPDVQLDYWQLSPDGHVAGIVPEVDINVFNGFKASFEEY